MVDIHIYIIQRILPQTHPRGIAITPPPLALDNENDMPAMFFRVRDCCWWIDRSNAGLEWAVKIGGVDVCTEVEPHRTQLSWSWYITREIWLLRKVLRADGSISFLHFISQHSTAEVAATNGLLEGRGGRNK